MAGESGGRPPLMYRCNPVNGECAVNDRNTMDHELEGVVFGKESVSDVKDVN